jgi:hypothetical protein
MGPRSLAGRPPEEGWPQALSGAVSVDAATHPGRTIWARLQHFQHDCNRRYPPHAVHSPSPQVLCDQLSVWPWRRSPPGQSAGAPPAGCPGHWRGMMCGTITPDGTSPMQYLLPHTHVAGYPIVLRPYRSGGCGWTQTIDLVQGESACAFFVGALWWTMGMALTLWTRRA